MRTSLTSWCFTGGIRMQKQSQTHGCEVGAQAMTPTPGPHTGGIWFFPAKHLRHCFAVEGSKPGETGQGRWRQSENRRAIAGGDAGDVEMDCHGVADGHMDACGEPAHCQPNSSRSPTRFELVSKGRSDPLQERPFTLPTLPTLSGLTCRAVSVRHGP